MTKKNSSHSNFKKGLNDYHDGESVTHYLGNDEYQNGANVSGISENENSKLDGKEAQGNSDLEDIEPDYNVPD